MAKARDRAAQALTDRFVRMYPGEVARKLETIPAVEVAAFMEARPAEESALVLDRLTSEAAARVLARLSDKHAREILPALDPGRAASLLARLDEPLRQMRLSELEPGLARELRELLTYPQGTAGHVMDARVMTFRPETTVREAVARLRKVRDRVVHNVHVVDAEGRLTGSVALQDLLLASSTQRLGGLVTREALSVEAMATREEVVELLERRRLSSVPVVDFNGRLLGVIRYDALMTATREEASVDLQTMVGASKEERALSKVSFAVRKRLPWLQVNLGTAFLAAAVVGVFEETIARFTALAVLLPVVAGQSGNTGAQALAVAMRGLALREIRPRHWLRVTRKEVAVAFINGVAVALTTSVGVFVWSRSMGLALVIGISMVISMVAAGLSGATIPMVLMTLRQDPAQASSIILTTVTDVVGFLSFLGIATALASFL
jgi:magnesium transporter